jgi:hypothetical protein
MGTMMWQIFPSDRHQARFILSGDFSYFGCPRWCPEVDENLPEEFRNEGIRIRDVGAVVSHGSCNVLFNITLDPGDSPHRARRVPNHFSDCIHIALFPDYPRLRDAHITQIL